MGNAFFDLSSAHAEYGRCIDDDRLEQWPDFFTDECLYRVTTARDYREGLEASIMSAWSKGMLRDRVSALRQANIYERQAYRHVIGAPCAIDEAGGHIRCESSFMVARIMRDGATDLFATGRYLDVFTRENGALKIAERVVVCDSHRIDTLLAIQR